MDEVFITTLVSLLSKLSPGMLSVFLTFTVCTPFGVVMLILVFWRQAERRHAELVQEQHKLLQSYREDTRSVLESYGKDMDKIASYYKSNVELVRAWEKIGDGLQDTVVLNTQTMQRMVDMCTTHQFCPLQRIQK